MATRTGYVDQARFSVVESRDGEILTLSLCGELDLGTAEAFHTAVEGAEASDASRVVIDLRALDFIDSTGLREVLIAGRRSEVNGDRLRVRAGKSEVRRLLELTAIDQTLHLID